jgi:hypothetical protein
MNLHKSPVKDVSKTDLTFESLERLSYFEPALRIEAVEKAEPARMCDAISPTPLRMILAKKVFLIPPDIALAAYARAHEPKSLVFLGRRALRQI